jgi:hypothetical protein
MNITPFVLKMKVENVSVSACEIRPMAKAWPKWRQSSIEVKVFYLAFALLIHKFNKQLLINLP